MTRLRNLVPAALAAFVLSWGCGGVPRLAVPLPFGALDPIGAPEPDGAAKLSGWVLSEDPIHTVSLYLDGRYVTSARLFQPRPDVNKAYPAHGNGNAGWSIDLDTGAFPGGVHELVIQARTIHGAVRDLGHRRMVFQR